MAIRFLTSIRPLSLSLAVIISNLLLCTTMPAQASNGDDYVLVERFQDQLKQAEAGKLSAMYEVGRMYELGRGTQTDIQKAMLWYERASQQGQNNARAELGAIYFEGNGIKRDLGKAFKLFELAARNGSATAQYYLGLMYERGEGVGSNINVAKSWYKQAEANGNYLASDRLKLLARSPARSAQTESPAVVLLNKILAGLWQRNGRAAAFLPSKNTKCSAASDLQISCQSGEEHRNIGEAIIVYATDATLFGFSNSNTFQVKYNNNVHKIQPVTKANADGQSTPRLPPNIRLGKQSLVHQLSCTLRSANNLSCVKDNSQTLTFIGGK